MGLRRFALLSLLLTSVAWTCAAVHTEDSQYHYFPGGVGSQTFVDATQFGIKADAQTDNCQGLQLIDATIGGLGFNGARVVFPPGEIRTSCPLPLRQQSTYEGSGAGGTIFSTPSSGNGNALMQVRTPRTCSGGAGTCNAAFGAGTFPAGCVCHVNADCTSGSCTGGTTARNVTIRDFRFLLRISNSVAIDFAGISESHIEDNFFSVSAASPVYDIILSDDGGLIAGYDNLVSGNYIQSATIGIWLQNHANGAHLIGNTIDSNVTGIQIDTSTNATQITNDNIQNNPTAGVTDNGQWTMYQGNRWEANNGGHLVIGASATHVSVSSKDLFVSGGAAISNSGTASVMDGIPFGTTAPVTCTASNPGQLFYDLSPLNTLPAQLCFCNGQATPKYCPQSGAACLSATDCV